MQLGSLHGELSYLIDDRLMISAYTSAYSYLLAQHLPLDEKSIQTLIEYAPDNIPGDLAFPCFSLAKKLKQSPAQIASDTVDALRTSHQSKPFTFDAIGPYINATIDNEHLAQSIINTVHDQKEHYGRQPSTHETVLIESPGPNTNKPLHLGHVRNMLLGNTLARLLSFGGMDVKKVDIINDRGVHICKSMLAYQRRGDGAQPDCKPDHFVGKWYVRFAQEVKDDPTLEDQAQEMLRKREAGDEEVMGLRTTMTDRCLEGMAQTYDRYHTHIDRAYRESEHYSHGAQLVRDRASEGVFETRDDGAIIYDFGKKSHGQKVLLRPDGTSIYITQDIALGQIRYEDYLMDRMIYIVGNEQEYHFKVLFELFDILGYRFANQCHHLSYGMIELPDGKMKSREGNVIDADTLADELHTHSYKQLTERYPDRSDKQRHDQAESIAIGAITRYMLLPDPRNNFVFDPVASISFEGETGPYIQYTYARCATLLSKLNTNADPDHSSLSSDEHHAILLILAQRPETVRQAIDSYQPQLIARYTLSLAKATNKLYHSHTMISDNVGHSNAHHQLMHSITTVLSIALDIIGIDTLDTM